MKADFEIIGKLLFEIIDDIEKHELNRVRKQEKNELHYLVVLAREPWLPFTLGRKFREALIGHKLIAESVSAGMINVELGHVLLDNKVRNRFKKLTVEEAGKEIVLALLKKRRAMLVVFPISGILPATGIEVIGNAVVGTYSNILQHFNIQAERLPSDEELYAKEKKHIISVAHNQEKEYANIFCAGTIVHAADNQAAAILAANEINLSLHLVRLLIPLECGIDTRPRISIYDLPDTDMIFVIAIENASRNLTQLRFSSIYPFITDVMHDRYKTNKAMGKASEIIRKNPGTRTVYENRIIEVLKWTGQSVDTTEKNIKVIKSVVALELLLCLEDDYKQMQFIHGVCRLFNGFGVDNTLIHKWAKQTYSLRSAIVHGGKTNVTDEEAEWAERLACGCILRVMETLDEFSSEDEFHNWLNRITGINGSHR